MFDKLTDKDAMEFIAKVEALFKDLPHLPKGIPAFLVKIAPWVALLEIILSLIAGPVIALVSVLSLITLNPLLVISTVVMAIITLVNAVLLLKAFGPLQKQEMVGWIYLFWVNMLSIVSGVLSLFGGNPTSIFGMVLGAVIGLYVLFEMKPLYKGAGIIEGEVVKEKK